MIRKNINRYLYTLNLSVKWMEMIVISKRKEVSKEVYTSKKTTPQNTLAKNVKNEKRSQKLGRKWENDSVPEYEPKKCACFICRTKGEKGMWCN